MQMLEFQHKCSSGFLRTTLLFACFCFFWQLQIVLLSAAPPPQKKKKLMVFLLLHPPRSTHCSVYIYFVYFGGYPPSACIINKAGMVVYF